MGRLTCVLLRSAGAIKKGQAAPVKPEEQESAAAEHDQAPS